MSAGWRLLVSVLAGSVAAAVTELLRWSAFVVMAGWIVTSATFVVWTWTLIASMDGATTKSHAISQDPPRRWAHVTLMGAVLASLVGVGYLVAGAASGTGIPEAMVGLVSIVLSWVLVHTLYTVRYAHLYYDEGEDGIDFPGAKEPGYTDFAYLAFTLGMTFQVSDTTLSSSRVRSTALQHALLSYLLGVVVIAISINLVVQLTGGIPSTGQ